MSAATLPSLRLEPDLAGAFLAWCAADVTARQAGTPGYKAAATKALDRLRQAADLAGFGLVASPPPLRLARDVSPPPAACQASEPARRAPAAVSARGRAGARAAKRETRASLLASGQVRVVRSPAEVWPNGVPDFGARRGGSTFQAIPICKPESAPDWLSLKSLREMTPAERDRNLDREIRRLRDHEGLLPGEIEVAE